MDAKEEVEPYHLFRSGSVSKLITAMTILKLVDEGELSLDNYVFGARGILNGKTYSGIKNEKLLSNQGKALAQSDKWLELNYLW